jgi:Family of unknown function (DUF6632)
MNDGERKMSDANRLLCLRIALIVFGLTFIFGVYPLSIVWPSGWSWGQGHSHYLMMIIGIYATLGVFLLIASRNPDAHRSIIWFTVWSSVVHGAIMAFQSFNDAAERGHLLGDVPALFLIAIVLGVLMPRAARA